MHHQMGFQFRDLIYPPQRSQLFCIQPKLPVLSINKPSMSEMEAPFSLYIFPNIVLRMVTMIFYAKFYPNPNLFNCAFCFCNSPASNPLLTNTSFSCKAVSKSKSPRPWHLFLLLCHTAIQFLKVQH